eukprot:21038-Pyramimonas_sp.AAC.1
MCSRHRFPQTLHTIRCLLGPRELHPCVRATACGNPLNSAVSWTLGSSGAARKCARRPFQRTPHAFRGPIGSPAEGPSGTARMCPPYLFHRPRWHAWGVSPKAPSHVAR